MKVLWWLSEDNTRSNVNNLKEKLWIQSLIWPSEDFACQALPQAWPRRPSSRTALLSSAVSTHATAKIRIKSSIIPCSSLPLSAFPQTFWAIVFQNDLVKAAEGGTTTYPARQLVKVLRAVHPDPRLRHSRCGKLAQHCCWRKMVSTPGTVSSVGIFCTARTWRLLQLHLNWRAGFHCTEYGKHEA